MAILQKRTSTRQIPQARGIERAPLDSIIRGVGKVPSISSGSPSTLTNTASTPRTTLTPRTSITSKTTPAKTPAISTATATPRTTLTPKTTITSTTSPKNNQTVTTSTKPATKTTTATSTVRPTVKPATTVTNPTTSKIVNAVTGAALGAGTKLLIDKFTGKPTTSTNKPKTTPNKVSTVAPVAPKKTTSVVKPKTTVTETVSTTPTEIYQYPISPTGGSPYDDEGNLNAGWQLDEDNNPVWVGLDEVSDTTTGSTESTATGGTRGLTVPGSDTTLKTDATVADNTDEEQFQDEDDNTDEEQFQDEDDNTDEEQFQDEDGNIYTMNEDGSYTLFSEFNTEDTTVDEDYYTDPDTGIIYGMADDGTFFEVVDDSTAIEGSTDNDDIAYNDYDDIAYNDYDDEKDRDYNEYYDDTDYPDDYFDQPDRDYNEYYDEIPAKRGGFITMMKNGGGMKGYADGGVTELNYDGTYNISYEDGTIEYYDADGQLVETTDTGEGSAVENTQPTGSKWPTGYVSNDDGTATIVDDDGSTITVDEDMNIVYSTDATNTTDTSGTKNPAAELSYLDGLAKNFGISPETLEKFTGALPAAGAGALVASLLGSDFGSADNLNKGVDMSKVGVINPRTTDFGIGPTRFVGYDDYGTTGDEYTPNAELLKNLNAPGYNPVNEGDYGYEEAPVEETAEAPKMASGGLSSMATPVSSYYTFGQPADILANLGMRAQPPMNPPEMMNQIGQQPPPQQAQQQGLPQQTPPQMAQQTPQGMPQQGMMPQQQGMPPPMRKGGLPHVSNVPLVEGRMDFRQGSAVHGEGDGQSDDIPAMLADGEYVIDAETVAQIGNGSTKAGAKALDRFREGIRAHKRSAPNNKIPPKTKALTSYLKGAK